MNVVCASSRLQSQAGIQHHKSKGLCLVVSDWHKSYLASLSRRLKGLWGGGGLREADATSLSHCLLSRHLTALLECVPPAFSPVTKYLVMAARENSISGQLYF